MKGKVDLREAEELYEKANIRAITNTDPVVFKALMVMRLLIIELRELRSKDESPKS